MNNCQRFKRMPDSNKDTPPIFLLFSFAPSIEASTVRKIPSFPPLNTLWNLEKFQALTTLYKLWDLEKCKALSSVEALGFLHFSFIFRHISPIFFHFSFASPPWDLEKFRASK